MTPRDAVAATRPGRPLIGPARRVVGMAWRVVVWLVVAAVILVLAAAVVVPRIGGATPYTILTDSMRPNYPPGTLVVIKPSDEIDVGDVVTYQLFSGKKTVVTHRVVAQGINTQGEDVYTTQGDANSAPDAKPVKRVQIRGELWYAVPWLGHLNTWLQPGERQQAVDLVVGALGIYMVWMFATAWRNRRRAGAPEAASEAEQAPIPAGSGADQLADNEQTGEGR